MKPYYHVEKANISICVMMSKQHHFEVVWQNKFELQDTYPCEVIGPMTSCHVDCR
jgi:hypothetical protein